MKKTVFLLLALGVLTLKLGAQTTLDEIRSRNELAGGNMAVYPVPAESLTPAPRGYVPFYLSHYARHGSRYRIDEGDYTKPIETLQRAKDQGVLSEKGMLVLTELQQIYEAAKLRYGDLTEVGANQHRGIGRRMYLHFPEIFSKAVRVDVRSTTVIRSILSGVNELKELQALNGKLHITMDASPHDMDYMNHNDEVLNRLLRQTDVGRVVGSAVSRRTSPERMMNLLFTDRDYIRWVVDSESLMTQLYDVATSVQDMDQTFDFDLLSLFTAEELYDRFQGGNAWWYLAFGPAAETRGLMPYRMVPLLENILDSADEALAATTESAALRFGHDTIIMPLAALLELDHWGEPVPNLSDLAEIYPNYRLIPMAANIQIVFYKHRKTGDVLVKFLLNERECAIPVPTDMAPYYHWNDVRTYYRNKLEKYAEIRASLEEEFPPTR